ncbi:cytochrome P450 78A3-like [Impatiens glandulifera]|uniref:cytochrome P450 78A3-like n=1 Tax=Impatiens glandulifera TaxID=253017 RepID=UPI001FB108C6|nr:cytochrome P450 78A3-like [Impatiens glandulifera]
MTPSSESLWIFALASKSSSLTSDNGFCLIFIMGFLWISMAVIYWLFPGGPAWGKLKFKSFTNSVTIPGPRGIPLIGSMNLLTGLSHRKIAAVANKLNAKRLMAFSIGETRAVAICDPNVAKEMLNSPVFMDRPFKESAYGLLFDRAIGFAPYGAYWRTLRRIAATHLFSPVQIRASEGWRSKLVDEMVTNLGSRMGDVCVRDVVRRASLNNMMCSVFGRNFGFNLADRDELGELVDEGYDLLGMVNWSDHLPWLRQFDLQGIRFRTSKVVPRVNRFVSRIIDEHRAQSGSGGDRDFVDVLLGLPDSDQLSESDMIAFLWEMIFRGTDAVAVLIEWVLARMMIHKDVQSKVYDELDKLVGPKPVNESNVAELVYLQAVIKEVLRLHPPGPLLSWSRLSITDTNLGGYFVPAGTTAMVNVWAIMRDPEVWNDPFEFKPERFMGNLDVGEISVMGSDMRLAPFGSGRRGCPGKALGWSTVTLWVARLVQEFEWNSPAELKAIDLTEVLRLSCEMASPLSAKLRRRGKCDLI